MTAEVPPDGGPVGRVLIGEPLGRDTDRRELTLQVAAAELAQRRQAWKAPQRPLRGVLSKCARLVGSAAEGAVCG